MATSEYSVISDSRPWLSEMRRKKRAVISQVAGYRVKSNLRALSRANTASAPVTPRNAIIDIDVPKEFEVKPEVESVENTKRTLRKNRFFHHEFDPKLGTSDAKATYQYLYNEQGDLENGKDYKNMYEYLKDNQDQIIKELGQI